MKTIRLKSIYATVVLLLFAGYVYALDPIVRITGAKKLILKYDKVSLITRLQLKDNNSNVLLSEDIKKSGEAYLRIYDLSELPNGSYRIELEDDLKIVNYSVQIKDDKVVPAILEKKEIYKPIAYERGHLLFVSKFNPEKAPFNITLYDNKDNVVYDETLIGEATKGKIFDFSNVNGEYKIVLSCNGRTYLQTVHFGK